MHQGPVPGTILRGTLVALLCVATGAGLIGPVVAAPPEIRGTWLTTTSSDDWSAANLPTTMQSLRRTGLNTVYVEAWKNGYTNFNSPTLTAFTGRSSLNPALSGRILLNETRTAAANAGIVHGAWFEYGLMAEFTGVGGDPSNPLAVKCRDATWTVGTTSGTGWLLQDSAGNYTNSSTGFVWMNPLVPEVRNLIKGIVVDAVNQFDLQIVQFDDHLAWPVQFGYDAYTRAVYRAETGRNLPTSFSDSRFVTWRQEKTQALFAEISDAVKAVKPSVVVSLSPSTASFSAANYCADWPDWLAKTDEVLPQVYRSTYASFATDWPQQITASGTFRPELGAGVRLLGTGSATPWNDLRQMIDRTRVDNALGHSIWYSEGVTNSGNPSASANYNTQLTAYYDVAGTGPAAHPLFATVRWAGSAGGGGGGTWSTLAASWKDRSTIWVRDAVGIFDGPGGAVTVSGSVGIGAGVEFRTDGYTVGGGTTHLLGRLAADNRIAVSSGATATLGTALSGSSGLTKSGVGTLVVTGGVADLRGGIVVEEGTLRLASAATTLSGSVSVERGTLAVDQGLAVTLAGLTVAESTGGRIDVGRGRITIAPGGITESALRADLIAGRGTGSFSGTGGIVTTGGVAGAAVNPAVGYRVLTSGSTVVAWSAFGDANLDGQVNQTDINLMLLGAKFGAGSSTGAVWSQGDFNYSGGVTQADINLILSTGLFGAGGYGLFGGTSLDPPLASVPEPGAAGSVPAAVLLAILVARRRGRRDHASSSSPRSSSSSSSSMSAANSASDRCSSSADCGWVDHAAGSAWGWIRSFRGAGSAGSGAVPLRAAHSSMVTSTSRA